MMKSYSKFFFGTVTWFLIGIAFAFLIGLAMPKHWEPKTTELVSLRDDSGVSGRFFLGTGAINENQYYVFYKKIGSGFQQGKVEVSDNVTIFEEEREDGEVKLYIYQFVNPSSWLWSLDYEEKKWEFFIPKGSIKRNFVLS